MALYAREVPSEHSLSVAQTDLRAEGLAHELVEGAEVAKAGLDNAEEMLPVLHLEALGLVRLEVGKLLSERLECLRRLLRVTV